MRWSGNEYDENGDLLHGFDHDLQVRVEEGVVEPAGVGCALNSTWAGRRWKEVKEEWLKKGGVEGEGIREERFTKALEEWLQRRKKGRDEED